MAPLQWLYLYIGLISLTAVILTAADKRAAIQHRPRVPEKTLLWIAVLGGSLAMYITMKLVRHKTKKTKFRIGIPLILLTQVVLLYFIWRFGGKIFSPTTAPI